MAGPRDPNLIGAERGPDDVDPVDVDEDRDAADPSSLTLDDLDEAEASRPTLPDETVDGLDELDEEIRHQAEDIPTDAPRRL